MKKYLIIIFYSFSFHSLFGLNDESNFYVGIGRVSITPPSDILSLSLAGYYNNKRGRWNLQWYKFGFFKNALNLAYHEGSIYVKDKYGQWWIKEVGTADNWTQLVSENNFRSLTGIGNALYGLDNNNVIWKRDLSINDSPWEKLLISEFEINSVTGINGKLYCIANGKLYSRDPELDTAWRYNGVASNIECLVGYRGKIYGYYKSQILLFDSSSSIWRCVAITKNVLGISSSEGELYIINRKGELFVSVKLSEEISAAAIAIRDKSGNKVVLVSVDLCQIGFEFVDSIRTFISKTQNIPKGSILINVSHTHFAPSTIHLRALPDIFKPDLEYLSFLKEKIIEVIEHALDNMEQSTLFFKRGSTKIGVNRNFNEFYKFRDDNLDVIKICNPEDSTIRGVLFFCGCHPVFGDFFTISPNFPGIARHMLESKIPGSTSIFFQGCAGDINPKSTDFHETGKTLGSEVLYLLNSDDFMRIEGEITSTFESFTLPLRDIRKNSKEFSLYKSGVTCYFPSNGFFDDNESFQNKVESYIQVIKVGSSWQLIGLSGEVTSLYGPEIRSMFESSNKKVTVIGYTNDVAYYIPNEMQIDKSYYEGFQSAAIYGLSSPFSANIPSVYLDSIWNIFLNHSNCIPVEKNVDYFHCSPNPFLNKVKVSFNLSGSLMIDINIFSMYGQKIGSLVHGYREKGLYEVFWDTLEVKPGVYFIVLSSKYEKRTLKLIKL